MLTTEQFEQRKRLMQTLGNTRLPYVIFAEHDTIGRYQMQQTLAMPAVKQQVIVTNRTFDEAFEAIKNAANTANVQIIIIIDNKLRTDLLPVFNEVCVVEPINDATLLRSLRFVSHNTEGDSFVYRQSPIMLGQIRAYKSQGCTIHGVKAQPYHTLYHVIDSNLVFLAIWDTRIIEAVGTTEEVDLLKHEHVNDNSQRFIMQKAAFDALRDDQRQELDLYIADFY